MELLLLSTALAAVPAPDYHDQVLRQVVAAPSEDVRDFRRRRKLAEEDQDRLQSLVEQYARAELDLRIVLLDAGPRFSLGDFTTRAWHALGGGHSDVLIVATSTGVHGQVPWFSYAVARQLAQEVQGTFDRDVAKGIAVFSERVLREGKRRARHRRWMIRLAMVAVLGMLATLALAFRRMRKTAAGESGRPV